MNYLVSLKESIIWFFLVSVFTIIPVFVYTKYKFNKQFSWLYIPLIFVSVLLFDFVSNFFNALINSTDGLDALTSQSNGDIFGIFLLILLLQYKGGSIYRIIAHLGGVYVITSSVNELYFSKIPVNMNTFFGYTLSLLAITGISVFICSILFKLLDLIAQQTERRFYGMLSTIIVILLVLGINVIKLTQTSDLMNYSDIQTTIESENGKIISETMLPKDIINMDTYLFIFAFICIFLVAVFSNIYLKSQRLRIQEERTKELVSYIETIEIIRDEVLSYQHDYDNIFMGISGYIYNEKIDLEQLQAYYEESVEKVIHNEGMKVIKLLNLKNIEVPEVKGILSQKILQARQKGIYVQLEVDEPIVEIPMDKIDLTRCLGILLDNALEAASQSEEKQLTIAFVFVEKQLWIIIKNSTDSKQTIRHRDLSNHRFSTKKEAEKHGFGLVNVHSILSKYEHIQLKTTILEHDFIQEIRISTEEKQHDSDLYL